MKKSYSLTTPISGREELSIILRSPVLLDGKKHVPSLKFVRAAEHLARKNKDSSFRVLLPVWAPQGVTKAWVAVVWNGKRVVNWLVQEKAGQP